METKLKKVKKHGFWDYLIALILALLVIIMFTQVFFRYVLNHSLSWSEELTKYLFVWLVFLGGALCLRDKTHIGVDFFISLLPDFFKPGIRIFNYLLITIFSILVTILGFMWVIKVHGTYTPALGWPLNLVFYAAVAVGFLLTSIYAVRHLISEFKQEEED